MTQLFIAIIAGLIAVWIFRNRARIVRLERVKKGLCPKTTEEKIPEPHSPIAPEFLEPIQKDISEINRTYRIADMHFTRRDFKKAEQWFIKVIALSENHPEALNRLGVIYIQQGMPRRAEILYRKLLSLTQREPAYYCNYGRCLYNQGKLREAIEAYENAIKLDASRPTRFISLGQIYYEQKDYSKALIYFVRALDLDPQNIEYLTISVELAEMAGNNDHLQKGLKKLAELDPYNEKVKEKLESLRNNFS